jgi:hypothetical protein
MHLKIGGEQFFRSHSHRINPASALNLWKLSVNPKPVLLRMSAFEELTGHKTKKAAEAASFLKVDWRVSISNLFVHHLLKFGNFKPPGRTIKSRRKTGYE